MPEIVSWFSCMVLNPYDLLGVTTNATCQEVRKRYYALACLCHPDRGGTNDQMQTLHNAYEYVMRQVSLNRTATFEDLEADFAAFCDSQSARPPPFADIYADAFNLPRFNELYELHKTDEVDGAFAEGGYPVCASEVTLEYDPVETHAIPTFDTAMVVYEEPLPVVMPHALVRDLTNPKLDDFSCAVGTVCASDYRAALSPPVPIPERPHVPNVVEAFERLVQERAC